MITDFDDFCTWMFVLIDDIWQVLARCIPDQGRSPTVVIAN